MLPFCHNYNCFTVSLRLSGGQLSDTFPISIGQNLLKVNIVNLMSTLWQVLYIYIALIPTIILCDSHCCHSLQKTKLKLSQVIELVSGHTSRAWVCVSLQDLILSPFTPIFSHPHKRFFSTYYVTGLRFPGLKTDIQSRNELLYLFFCGCSRYKPDQKRGEGLRTKALSVLSTVVSTGQAHSRSSINTH